MEATPKMMTASCTQTKAGPAGPEPDFRVLQRLRQACRVALERYVDIASNSSGHLARLTPGSIDKLGRVNLDLLVRKEEKAHDAYLNARATLLDYLLQADESSKPDAP
jgi:hypothetical protein